MSGGHLAGRGCCIRLSRVLTSAVSSLGLYLTRLAGDLFQQRPGRLDRVELGGVRRRWKAVSQSLAAIRWRIAWLTWVLRLSQTRTAGPPSCWWAESSSRA